MNKKFSIVREVWLGLGLILFSLFFIGQCDTIANQSAADYPRMMLSVLLAMSTLLFAQGLYYTFMPAKYLARFGKSNKSVGLDVVGRPLITLALTALYVALFIYINFFVATAVFVPLLMLLFGERKMITILCTTVGLELFVYLVFMKLLSVHFPM